MKDPAVIKLLREANYLSALRLLLEKLRTADKFDKDDIKKEISDLIRIPVVQQHLGLDMMKCISDAGINIGQAYRKQSRTGYAEFPAVSSETDSIRAITSVRDRLHILNIQMRSEERTKFLKFRESFLNMIQRDLRDDQDKSLQDTTILNWGIGLELDKCAFPPELYDLHDPEYHNTLIDGTSFSFAAAVSFFSYLFEMPVRPGYIFTGSFKEDGSAEGINEIERKLKLIERERPETEKIFVPPVSSFLPEEQDLLSGNDKIVHVFNCRHLIELVFGRDFRALCSIPELKRKTLGSARITARFLGKVNFKGKCKGRAGEDLDVILNTVILKFDKGGKTDKIEFNHFPVADFFFTKNSEQVNFVVLEGTVANQYTGNYMANNRQNDFLFGVRRFTSTEVIAFGSPTGRYNDLVGAIFDFSEYFNTAD